MEFSSKFIENAVNEISNLPGIGKKSALRLVLFLLRQPESQSKNLANAISEMRLNVNFCKNCHNISDLDVCEICSNPRRDQSSRPISNPPENNLAVALLTADFPCPPGIVPPRQ